MSVLSRIAHPVSRITFFTVFCLGPLTSFAHEVRPAYLEIREEKAGEFSLLWKTPMRREMRLSLAPEFSGKTENVTPVTTRETGDAAVQTWRMRAVEPLRGQSVRIAGLDGTITDALVRVEFANGATWVQRLTPQEPSAAIPARQNGWAVADVYLKLGVEHILLGVDHLLFVLALLLITRGAWRLVKTVSAFTVAHSITLGLATLGFVHVPARPVEAIIALSIVFVAAEIVRQQLRYGVRDTGHETGNARYEIRDMRYATRDSHPASRDSHPASPSLTARAPWIVAFSFGLLHGFGFAGALSEIGLPEGHIPLALLFFNLGVEAGQLLFIATVLALLWVGRDALKKIRDAGFGMRDMGYESRISYLESRIVLVPAYAIGSVAMFWVIQRIVAF